MGFDAGCRTQDAGYMFNVTLFTQYPAVQLRSCTALRISSLITRWLADCLCLQKLMNTYLLPTHIKLATSSIVIGGNSTSKLHSGILFMPLSEPGLICSVNEILDCGQQYHSYALYIRELCAHAHWTR